MFRSRTAYILIIVSLLSTHIICARSAIPAESENPGDPPAATSPWSQGDPPSVPWSRMAYGGAFVLAVGLVAL